MRLRIYHAVRGLETTMMLITWCRDCLGIALPVIRSAKGKVRWWCPICRASLGIKFVEIIEEPVRPHLYKMWTALQHALELSVMAGEPVPYIREMFYRDAGLEVPPLPS